ncbi:MAG TPA: diguanylate cyclase, partial [Burkholderiales bacterium]|nr:diguanylate cyclase [Burkholderiales bacterium]
MRLGLGAKFTLTVLVILAGTNAASTLYDLNASFRFHEQQLIERGRALGRLISLVSPEAILGFDFLALNNYTREVSEQPDIVYSAITTPDGAVLSSHIDSTDPLAKKHLARLGSGDALKVLQNLGDQDGLIKLQFPITHDGRLLGHFLVGLSREAVQSEFRRQLTIKMLVLAAVVLFLSIAIHLIFRFNVLHPIQRLIAASQKVGRGQHALVDVKSSDEMGLLAKAFNAMAEGIKEEQAQLHRQANFDTLTGLPNRLMVLDRINMEISRAKRSAQRFAVLFIDLDDFKSVNDSLGHAVGDRLLVAIGARLQAAMRDADTVARLGGDEFLILAADIESEVQVEMITERLLETVVDPQELSGRKVVARCSIG